MKSIITTTAKTTQREKKGRQSQNNIKLSFKNVASFSILFKITKVILKFSNFEKIYYRDIFKLTQMQQNVWQINVNF